MKERRFDLVVLGSGAGGLTAALTAALSGLSCILVEHEAVIGGTSARSSGTIWVPDNHHLRAQGDSGDRARAESYLASLVGNRGQPAMWRAFLDCAPAMLHDLEERAGLSFRPLMAAPDYRQDHPGAAAGGRALEPAPFDGRRLGTWFDMLAAPPPEFMLFGGMMVTRAEAARLLRGHRSLSGLALGLRLVGRFVLDRVHHPRGTRLVLGNGLVARLLKACLDNGVEVLASTRTHALVRKGDRVIGVEIASGEGRALVLAERGVVLAGGGFPASPRWRAEQLPRPVAEHTPAAPGCDGSTIELALCAGAVLGPEGFDNALWFPSSIAKRRDGSTALWPHIVLDRSKPGLIAVDGVGSRFVNEAVSYHEFVRAMYAAGAVPCWLICDRSFIRRYGLGLVRPGAIGLARLVKSGYLHEAGSITALAARAGLPEQGLAATIERYNRLVAGGQDSDFGKGETIYDRSNGDASVSPNPCLGPIAAPPFYALPVVPTPLGTSRGLAADPSARVLDEAGGPIPGLYVCGNDMQHVFGGEYPGAGAQLGQAMTFGWIAARHAADQAPVSGITQRRATAGG